MAVQYSSSKNYEHKKYGWITGKIWKEAVYIWIILPIWLRKFKEPLKKSWANYTKGGFLSESVIRFSNLQISKMKIFQKTILSLKFEFVVYWHWREI